MIADLLPTSIDSFDKEVLGGITIWSKQKEIWQAVRDNKYTVVRSAHGIGKTCIAARIALWFLYTNPPPCKVITTAPTNLQVTMQLWKEIRQQHAKAKGFLIQDNIRAVLSGRVLIQSIELDEDWFAIGFRPRETEPERFQGWHARNILVIFDEAAGIARQFWNAKEGLMTSNNSHFLAIGNPSSPSGQFYESFKDPQFKKIQVSAFDSPNFEGLTEQKLLNMTIEEADVLPLKYPDLVTPGWVRRKMDTWGINSALYISKVRGDFAQESPDTIISLLSVEEAERKWMELEKVEV